MANNLDTKYKTYLLECSNYTFPYDLKATTAAK